MLKNASTAIFAAVLLGVTPALATDTSASAPARSTTTMGDRVLAQAQHSGSGHGSMSGVSSGMSHEKMMEKSADGNTASVHVVAHGTVNSVNESDRTVNLSHEPISALGWPSMTMDMKVADGVDLSKVPVGKPIDFTMSRGADGIYLVDTITAQ